MESYRLTPHTRDPVPFAKPFLARWTSTTPTPNFVVDDDWVASLVALGFGGAATPSITETWTKIFKDVYSGDEGRRKLRSSAICLAERDGLLLRIGDVKCPVHWLQVSSNSRFYIWEMRANQKIGAG